MIPTAVSRLASVQTALPQGEMVAPETWSSLINLAGRQRMLSQRIALMALLADRGDRVARSAARDALQQFSTAHERLTQGGDGLPPPPASALREAFFGHDGADAAVRRFISLARQIVDGNGGQDREALTTLVELATPLLTLLNHLTQSYETHARASAQRAQQRQASLISSIERVAGEARIVAMNARIAAARAGDGGREFGVVAARLVEVSSQIESLSHAAMK
ncbi:type IV pili methyl-accepting chemotaxis transducer N-terminal domain-containing protein [Aquabacterium sp.]|uniref:type IV pili methyl-accepting chemotaxis transducer N-terminal domain-containing protein n=1 Tax=Aquabacterium sp. TaxID=1872578 RepID=UPI002BC49C21|nr:type IV pili methyl-accepting chemotaxis transducer N-terminal domain-containing protein [Aquabacterium sp.]HSW07857.1 type IV pili methyl-accepting chemotaxis transducer N-terminal domain-containing protein [Aquabacterium sp.]